MHELNALVADEYRGDPRSVCGLSWICADEHTAYFLGVARDDLLSLSPVRRSISPLDSPLRYLPAQRF